MTDAAAPQHYALWEPKRAVTLAAARRRATIGRGARALLWVGSAALGAAVLYYLLTPEENVPAPVLAPPPPAEAGVVRMTNFHFSGRDEDGQPFQVLGDTAIRRAESEGNITELDFPRLFEGAGLDVNDLEQARVLAQRGRYDADRKVLELFADVDLETENGYAFKTNHARIFVDERRAEGDEPVEGRAPFGSVTADRWSFVQDGEVLHFEGNVRTVIEDDSARGQEESGQ